MALEDPVASAAADVAADELELELDELEQAASTGAARAVRPPAVSRRRRLRPALTMAEVLVVAIETEVPLSLRYRWRLGA
jgi:hypothetical protein